MNEKGLLHSPFAEPQSGSASRNKGIYHSVRDCISLCFGYYLYAYSAIVQQPLFLRLCRLTYILKYGIKNSENNIRDEGRRLPWEKYLSLLYR